MAEMDSAHGREFARMMEEACPHDGSGGFDSIHSKLPFSKFGCLKSPWTDKTCPGSGQFRPQRPESGHGGSPNKKMSVSG